MSNLELARTQAQGELKLVQTELEQLEGWIIESVEDNQLAADVVADIKRRHKALETKRKSIVDPMNKALKEINSLFQPPRQALERAEAMLKRKIADYLALQEKKNEQALEAAAEAESVEEATSALAQIKDNRAPKGVSVRYKFKAIVEDESKVPRQFLSADLNKIRSFTDAAVKERGEPLPIEGVRFEKVPIVTSRGRKKS